MSAKTNREIEIKLRTNGSPCEPADVSRAATAVGIELRELDPIEQVDVYLDDARFHLTQAGIGLRVRATPTGRVLAAKIERARKGVAFERDEVETKLEGDPPARVADLPLALRDRIEPFLPSGRLKAIAGLCTTRQRLRGAGLEVAIDRVEVRSSAGDAIGTFAEVELELASDGRRADAEMLADALRAEFALTDAPNNKLRHALELASVRVEASEVGPITPDLPIAEAGRRVLARHFLRMQREEVRVRTGNAVEPVHRLRVACRRMRTALRTFKPWIAGRDRRTFRDALYTTGSALGEVRDLEVLAIELSSRSDQLPAHLVKAARGVIERLRTRGTRQRHVGREALRAPARLAAIARLQKFVERPAAASGEPTVETTAPGLIREAAETAFAHGRTLDAASPTEAVHRLRILMKRLRYTAECFVDTYGKDLVRFVERTEHLQEVLGEFNDTTMTVRTLRATTRRERDLKPRELQAIGALATLEHLRGIDTRRRFEAVWAEFDTDDLRTWLDAVLRSPARG